MTADRRTKAQLVSALKRSEADREEALDLARRARDRLPAEPVTVPEADALATCIRAIDSMLERPLRGGSSGFSYEAIGTIYGPPPEIPHIQSEVERLLRSLAAKYQVPLVEVQVKHQECHRAHLDEVNPEQVLHALGARR